MSMELFVVGFNHRSASVPVRESLARLAAAELLKRLRDAFCPEAVVLSTCNRFELYAVGGDGQDGRERVIGLLEKMSGSPLKEHAYVHCGSRAVRQLFEVSSGLDSLVVGETEILGQVKTAYEQALSLGMTGKTCNVLFQRALFIGKMVRNDTGIAVGQTSVASVAVQLAESIFGALRESEVLILGAGMMAELTAKHLLSKKVSRLTIANRTWANARELAGRINAQTVEWERFGERLESADIVIASTGSDRPVLTREVVSAALKARAGRSLFLIDIAMPRDVDEAVHGLDHVYLYRLGDLEAIVAENLKSRGGEIERARRIVSEKAAEFAGWADSVAAGREISLKHSSVGTT